MQRVTHYKVIVAQDDAVLGEQVQIAIAEGWQPIGGIGVQTWESQSWGIQLRLYQAVVKYDAVSAA